MKKFTVLMLAALLVVAFTVPASALENIFGGYWRTRMYVLKDFDGDNTGVKDQSLIDTRTRLYYTAKLNDNLKLVNKFEIDTVWGDPGTVTAAGQNWGDVGTDGRDIQIKNSYADFNLGPVNFLIGAQAFTLARGFISDEDALGAKAIWKVNDGLYLPFIYEKLKEGGSGKDANEQDAEAYIFTPVIYLSKDVKINPYYVFFHAEDGKLIDTIGTLVDNVNVSMFGLDFDAKMGAASLWFTGIMQFGDVTINGAGAGAFNALAKTVKTPLVAGDTLDFASYLIAAGGKFDLGKADIHGQAFYASGDDDYGYTDGEINGFFNTASTAYYWSEIMGGGIFDGVFPTAQGTAFNISGPTVTNIMAANLGVTVKPMDKLSITADLWWAKLAEENADNKDKLGVEADLKITYTLVEGLTLDLVGAYLWAGDAMETNNDGKNQKNPMEVGTRLSLSF
ncbi:MAG: alginate export family protein [Proteobacteria bacterium]|nr:alginate export family protein [Pseudomonadota bacterium]